MSVAYRPIFALMRGHAAEIVVYGAVGLGTGTGQTNFPQGADLAHLPVAARSLLKPFQMLAANVFGTESYWAMALASHMGSAAHEAALRQLQAASGVELSELSLAACLSMDARRAHFLEFSGVAPSPLFHPCCGKHLMYAYAHRLAGGTVPYHSQIHPVHERLDQLIRATIGADFHWLPDSCGLPTLVSSLASLLALYRSLAWRADERSAELRRLWLSEPELIGGSGRLDSGLVACGAPRVLAKEGADGLLALQTVDPGAEAFTVVIKLSHGYQAAHLGLALLAVLGHVRELPPALAPVLAWLREQQAAWVPAGQNFVALL